MRDTINPDDETLALHALIWVLGDDRRADHLLALTGLEAHEIRDRLADRALLVAVLDFLSQHEPDLIACAQALGHRPDVLIHARERLTR